MTDFVLIIGSGGREHALSWKLSQSYDVKHVYVSPGNAGTDTTAKISNCDINIKNHADIELWCKNNNIKLVVIGPEDPLANGLADHLKKAGIKCFGPCQQAAQIEASKEFAKAFMDEFNIPTARWKSFKNAKDAQDHIASAPYDALVVKASGLAAGKGVIVGKNKQEAIEAVNTLKQDKGLSAASDTIIIEELLTGEELSVLCFSDGSHFSVMPPAQDYKRLLNNDEGPNTGGMGAYCRCPLVSDKDMEFIKKNVLQRSIEGMKSRNSPYVGVLYAGLMLTKDGPKVLEFNCRFGDPETQVILPLLETDLYTVMLNCVEGRLDSLDLQWSQEKHAVGVVVVSGGYPASYPKGKVITGLHKVISNSSIVFHAGTSKSSGNLVTSGGRVLTVVSVSDTLKDAAAEAHLNARLVQFEGAFFRTDIAKKGLLKVQPKGMTYKSSGVDIESADDLVKKISSLCKQTLRKEVCGGIGGFGGIFELSGYKEPYLVSNIGNVGEKLKVAHMCGNFNVIGWDLVATSVNEILCHGAEPLFFLDTFTCGKLDVGVAADIITGIAKGCKESNCALIGGETGEMPGMYFENDFDLTSFVRGAVEKHDLLPKNTISKGDIAIGLLSSSLNINALRTVKKLMSRLHLEYNSTTPFDNDKTFGQVLLEPHDNYVRSILPLMRKGLIKAASFINKNGVSKNLKNILPSGHKFVLDPSKLTLPPVYTWIAQNAHLSTRELFEDYNCGVDMVLVSERGSVEEVMTHIESNQKKAVVIGEIGDEKCDDSLKADEKSIPAVPKTKVAILTSKEGTSLKALIDYSHDRLSSAEVVVLILDHPCTNVADVESSNVNIKILNEEDCKTQKTKEKVITETLKSNNVEIVCLDHFPKDFSGEFLDLWKGKILSIHPSLLPAFNCSNAHSETLAFGARISGCTVHLIEGESSVGKIIEQAAIDIKIEDTLESLTEKLVKLQNYVYPKALENFVSEKNLGNLSTNLENGLPQNFEKDLENLNQYVGALMKSTNVKGYVDFVDPWNGIFDLGKTVYQHPHLISGTDGVGTKLKIAQTCNKHDTIGIDLVAMCVNDIMTHGAEPLFFLSCFDCGQINQDTVKKVISGITEGCKQAGCVLAGAEINEMPDIYLNPKQCLLNFNKYDVVGYAEGAVRKENLMPKLSSIKDGDIVIGLSSSGVHSNGYSLVRKLVEVKNFRYQDPFPLDPTKTLGEVLLEPTKIYVKSVLDLIQQDYVKAAAHITGGGLTQNIPRVLPRGLKVVLDGSKWNVPLVLKWIAKEGQLSKEEMLQTFNCGLGMVLIVEPSKADEVLKLVEQRGEMATNVGHVTIHKEGEQKVEVYNYEVHALPETKKKKKVGVLISGSGTNLQALIDYTQDPNNCSSAEIVLVISNVAEVEGLNRAIRAGIPTKVLSHKNFKKRVEFDMAVHELLKESEVEIVCLAGFMRILSKEFVHLWQGNLLNVHPAILPAFKGMNAHRQAIEAGAKVTGCSVHFVEAEVDAGAVIEQAAARVDPTDTESSLQEKVKKLEHQIFPTALELLASERVSRGENGKLIWHF